jgi:3',5'-cyclic AMP phosphodiesterase CpdA
MLKILHLTDLHICDKEVLEKLTPVFTELSGLRDSLKAIGQELPPEISLEHAEEWKLDRIVEAVKREKPDLIVITGDITTFGDKKSFEKAKAFVNALRLAGQKDSGAPIVMTVPGNHDVLAGALKGFSRNIKNLLSRATNSIEKELPKLIREAPFLFGFIGRLLIKKNSEEYVFRREAHKLHLSNAIWSSIKNFKGAANLSSLQHALDTVLADPDINADESNPWNNYEAFHNDAECFQGNWKPANGNIKIICARYDSVSKIPFYLNLGTISPEKFARFNLENERQGIQAEKEDLYIVLLHHNPISSPDSVESPLTNAYNSMPGGPAFIKSMLDDGVDLMLYGHQHQEACFKVDVFQLERNSKTKGHLFLLGGASGTIGEHAGFTIVEVQSRFVAHVTKYTINKNTGQYLKSDTTLPLIFENNYALDTPTISTRKEIRNSCYTGSPPIWDDTLNSQSAELYLIGPRQESLSEFAPLSDIKRAIISNNCKVNILLSEPKLFKFIEEDVSSEAVISRLNEIWDIGEKDFSWRNQSLSSAQGIVKLLNLKDEINHHHGSEYSEKLQIKTSHTLMSIGARCKDLEKDTGHLLIRLLPVGVFSDFEHLPIITLKKRYDKALFDYYAQYIRRLWEHGRLVNGASKVEYEAIGRGEL